ncbi:uncharacterized protein LOC143057442 [Mytilus galloprovincialis]|uniref:uncharacterized protein LOC143057442 n=1 Tax=Mytilus galloprovincialis TaxID=29158 RepID=UPI003F7BAF1C
MPLPDLSPSVSLALNAGHKTSDIFNQLLKECEIFYTTKYPTMADSSYYQSIGKKMISKFPCLAFVDGTNKWSFFVSKLGQRIRTSRWKENRKSRREVPDDNEIPTPQKRFKLGSKQREQSSLQLVPSEDWDNHVEQLGKEWDGKRAVSHIRIIMSQTRTRRMEWQHTLKPGKFQPIVEKFPCFEEGSFVLREFFCTRGKEDPDSVRSEISSKMEKLLKHIAETTKNSEETEALKSLSLFNSLENAVARKKGKGQKSKSCIKVVKNVQNVDQLPQTQLETAAEDPPRLVVFLDPEEDVSCIYVVGDNTQIFGQTTNILDAIVLLIACYYVFDLDYPAIYSQVLGLIQHWVIGDPFTENKTSAWIKFSDELSRGKFSVSE